MDVNVEEEEGVHDFTEDLDLGVKSSMDETEVVAPSLSETRSNSRFLSNDLSASRSPRFSNPTIERQNSFKYRKSSRTAPTDRVESAIRAQPEVVVATDSRAAYQSGYDEIEIRVRSAPPNVPLKKVNSPKSSRNNPVSSASTPKLSSASHDSAVHQSPRIVTPAHKNGHTEHPAAQEFPVAPTLSAAPSLSSAHAPAPTPASVPASSAHVARSPAPATTTPAAAVKKEPVRRAEPNKRLSGIPAPQKTNTPAKPVHPPAQPKPKPAGKPAPTTELLSPIRARNFEEALKSATVSSRPVTPQRSGTPGRSSTPTSLRRPQYSIENLPIHGAVTPTIDGKDWNSSVRVRKPNPNLEAQEHLNLIKMDSGEKPLSRMRSKPSSESLNKLAVPPWHDSNASTHSRTSGNQSGPGTSSTLFSPVSQRKYTPNGSRANSRSTTPTGLRPPSSRPTSRSTTPTNASNRRGPSLAAYFNNEEMTDISGGDSQPAAPRTPASGSLLSPYNLMVAAPHGQALDSDTLSDADLQSVGKQMLLLKLLLQSKSAADQEKEEADILHAWSVVHAAEEQARLMATQDSGIEEVTRVHQQIVDMEAAIDKLNDHLAPAFERLSAYNNAKAEQLALNASSSASNTSSTATSAELDPLLDAYGPRAQAHKELQARLAGLARSIAALKRTTESEDFVSPAEETLAAAADVGSGDVGEEVQVAEPDRAVRAEEQTAEDANVNEATEADEEAAEAALWSDEPVATTSATSTSTSAITTPKVVPAVSAVRVTSTPASVSPVPTKRLSTNRGPTLVSSDAHTPKNARMRAPTSTAPPSVPPGQRSKSPAPPGAHAATQAPRGTTSFNVPAAARPTAASRLGTRSKSPAPATAAAARTISTTSTSNTPSNTPGAGSRARSSLGTTTAAMANVVASGKEPKFVQRVKKVVPEPASAATDASATDATATAIVETADEETADAPEDPVLVQEQAVEQELNNYHHLHHLDSEEEAHRPHHLSDDKEEAHRPHHLGDEEAETEELNEVDTELIDASPLDGDYDIHVPVVFAAAAAVKEELPEVVNEVDGVVKAEVDEVEKEVVEVVEEAEKEEVEKVSSVDAHLNSMFEMVRLSEDSADEASIVGVSASAIETPSTPPSTTTTTSTTAATTSGTTGEEQSVDASPGKKARGEAFERLMKRLNQNKEANDGANSTTTSTPGDSGRTSPATTTAAATAVQSEAVTGTMVDGVASVDANAANSDNTSTDTPVNTTAHTAASTANTDESEPVTRRASVAEMLNKFGGKASPAVKDGLRAASPSFPSTPVPAGTSTGGAIGDKVLGVDTSASVGAGAASPATSLSPSNKVVSPSAGGPGSLKRVQSTRVSELMNKFGGSRKDLLVPSPVPAPISRANNVRGSILSISSITPKKAVYEKDGTIAEETEGSGAAKKSPVNRTNISVGGGTSSGTRSPGSLSPHGSSHNLTAAMNATSNTTSKSPRSEKSPGRSSIGGSASGSSSGNRAMSPLNKSGSSGVSPKGMKSTSSFSNGSASAASPKQGAVVKSVPSFTTNTAGTTGVASPKSAFSSPTSSTNNLNNTTASAGVSSGNTRSAASAMFGAVDDNTAETDSAVHAGTVTVTGTSGGASVGSDIVQEEDAPVSVPEPVSESVCESVSEPVLPSYEEAAGLAAATATADVSSTSTDASASTSASADATAAESAPPSYEQAVVDNDTTDTTTTATTATISGTGATFPVPPAIVISNSDTTNTTTTSTTPVHSSEALYQNTSGVAAAEPSNAARTPSNTTARTPTHPATSTSRVSPRVVKLASPEAGLATTCADAYITNTSTSAGTGANTTTASASASAGASLPSPTAALRPSLSGSAESEGSAEWGTTWVMSNDLQDGEGLLSRQLSLDPDSPRHGGHNRSASEMNHSLTVSHSDEFIHVRDAQQYHLATVREGLEGSGDEQHEAQYGSGDTRGSGLREREVVDEVSAKLTAHFTAKSSDSGANGASGASGSVDENDVRIGSQSEDGTVHSVQSVYSVHAEALHSHHATAAHDTTSNTTANTTSSPTANTTSNTTSNTTANATSNGHVYAHGVPSPTAAVHTHANFKPHQSGGFSDSGSDATSTPHTNHSPLTPSSNLTSSLNTPTPLTAVVNVSSKEAEGDFNQGPGEEYEGSDAGSNATSTKSKKGRRPTLKGLWKRMGVN